MRTIYQDDMIDFTEPYIGAYPAATDVNTVKELTDALTTAVIEVHKAGDKWPGEGAMIAADILVLAQKLDAFYCELELERAGRDQ